MQLPARTALALSLAALAGCGAKYYPVHGKVTLPGGQPVPGSLVVFEGTSGGKSISARGEVGADGSYSLSTNAPGDGAPPGKYRVSVAPPPAISAEGGGRPPFHVRFSRVETSNLEFEVKPQDNEYSIQVTK